MFLDLFEEGERQDLPPHQPHDHDMELLPGKTAPFMKLYPLREDELKVLQEYLEKNLERNWISPTACSAGAPILFVKKKDGGLRTVGGL